MMLLLVQGVAGVEAENVKTRTTLRALKTTKKSNATKGPKATKKSKSTKGKATKSPKGKKSTKCPKSIGKLSVDSVPLDTDTSYPPELLDPDYWHPKSKNFAIIDWERWDALKCVVPKVVDFPQRYDHQTRQDNDEMDWWHRSKLNFPGIDAWQETHKPDYGLVSDETLDLFSKLLGPHPNSSLIPEALRNKLYWMENNDASEALVSFNRWAWRSQTDGNGRPIGLGWMQTDWTNSPNDMGIKQANGSGFINVQQSPDKKWIKLAGILPHLGHPSSADSMVIWLDIYVVQEGEVYTDRDGNVLDYVKPGDLFRFNGDQINPYTCNEDTFYYFPRTVAVLDEETGKITPECPHYEALIDNATGQPSKDLERKTFGFTNASELSREERWDFQVSYLSDIQMYSSAATPPLGDDIENL